MRFPSLSLVALSTALSTTALGAQAASASQHTPPRAPTAHSTAASAPAPNQTQRKTKNVVLIVTDGLRWQEVFTGAEQALMSARPGGVRDSAAIARDFWRDTPEARREALFPFLWGTIAKQGVIYGNQTKGSVARITNTMAFSYPGYNEIFTGAFDPRIDSNEYPPNPNETIFEWMAKKPAFGGRVGAVATWSAFRRIFNKERADFPVLDGWNPPFADVKSKTEREATIDELYATSAQLWPDNAFDAPMHLTAKDFIRTRRPRLLFVGYGETDEWAHSGMYDMLLRSAHQVDAFVADLWNTMQAIPQYRGTTTFIITTDHGRGSGATQWRDHGRDSSAPEGIVPGANNIWIAMIGPDTPALGERTNSEPVTQSQIAATIASLLGEDWNAANPKAGKPLPQQ